MHYLLHQEHGIRVNLDEEGANQVCCASLDFWIYVLVRGYQHVVEAVG